MKKTVIEQGDVLFFLEEIPKNAEKTKLKDGIVEHGESTGHAHRLTSNSFEYFETPQKTRHLRIAEPISLRHEEHAPIVLPPGDYQIRRVVEKEMFGDMVNPVVD